MRMTVSTAYFAVINFHLNQVKENKLNIPELKDGEVYAGAIIKPDGKTIHTILLPGDEKKNWKDGMEWAKSIGGDLPDRAEQALFYKYMPEEFQKEAYWSNTQHAGNSNYAWYQLFYYGFQLSNYKSADLRVRAVRRVGLKGD